MRPKLIFWVIVCVLLLPFSACRMVDNVQADRASALLDSLMVYYPSNQPFLYYEYYPYDKNLKATYLAGQDTISEDKVAYLWPTSGIFSGVNALLRVTDDKKYEEMLEKVIVPGLDRYYDDTRLPAAYQSYIASAGHSDRFYDDNVWLGLDFLESYHLTGKDDYLNRSKEIWTFLVSGCDDQLGGGMYWCEQKKESKNTCSNAPASVLGLKLFQATGDSLYFYKAKGLYEWTKKNLQDGNDYVFFDNIKLNGRVDKAKFAYNTGQMLQAAALLYKLTKDENYLNEAQNIAKGGINYFTESYTTEDGTDMRFFKNRGVWFLAVMFRGYVELYSINKDYQYIQVFEENLNLAWEKGRYANGLINADWSGRQKEKNQWLLNQGAMVELYATLAAVKNGLM